MYVTIIECINTLILVSVLIKSYLGVPANYIRQIHQIPDIYQIPDIDTSTQ